MIYNQNIFSKPTVIPTYNDGFFKLFTIHQTKDTYPIEYLHEENQRAIYFEELSLTDRLRFDAEERKKKLTYKIRIPQMKNIDSLCVVKIGNAYHKVFNAFHFTNNDGFKQTDLTLEEYPRVKLEEDVIK